MDSKLNIRDDEEVLRDALDAQIAMVWTAIPCIVAGVNYEKQTIRAQPAIQGIKQNPDGTFENVTITVIDDLPVQSFGNNDFAVTIPVKVGDEVLAVFASRCIDGWWDTGKIAPQLDTRMHDLSDGFAILGFRSRPKSLPAFSSSSLQIRNKDGDCFIELNPSKNVRINTPATVEIIANSVNVTAQETTINSPAITMNGNVAVNGSLTTSGGNVSMSGNVSHSGGSLESNGITLHTHIHSGVVPGGGNTGEPV